jgi:ABC-type transport system substrate-binding protein
LLRGKERVPVVVWGFDDVADTAEHIAAVLRDLGYSAEHRTLPIERFFGKVMTEPDVQAGVVGWFGDLPGAFSFIAPNFGCAAAHSQEAANFAHHCDPAIDRLGRKAGRLQFSDPRRANELFAHIDRMLTRTAAWVPLVNPKGVELVSDRVGNYMYNPVTGMVLSQAWVQ